MRKIEQKMTNSIIKMTSSQTMVKKKPSRKNRERIHRERTHKFHKNPE
jgi:hypothetical protein